MAPYGFSERMMEVAEEQFSQEGRKMNARDLLIEKLKEIGADGLYHGNIDCGCGLDDFEPCCECELSVCEPAKKRDDGMFCPMRSTEA
jgi:hypothetical protein